MLARLFASDTLVGIVSTVLLATSVSAEEAAEPLYFESDIRPILKEHCFQCHGEDGPPKSQLDLRFTKTMIEGGLTGEAIVPGDSESSFLWQRIFDEEMPPGDIKLSAEQKEVIAAWIDQGARTARPEPEEIPPPGMLLTEEDRSFWSFQPIQRPEVPTPMQADRVRTPIDAFLLRRLEDEGLEFSPEADRRTLIRRATFDLLGLPPTPEEIETFLQDDRPDAYERLIDRLLESPHYGERWARHWMDVAGYADSEGYTLADPVRPWAYRYRDYLIRAMNEDRPWDELIVEQLAGDELVGPISEDLSQAELDRIIATGFLRMAPDGTADREADPVTSRNDVIADTINIVSTSLLGLTVGCAQCHSHRYDPISHEDYHRLRALFEPALDPSNWKTPPQRLVSLWDEELRQRNAEVDAEVARITKQRTEALEELVARTLEAELQVAPEPLREALRSARDTPKAERTEEQEELLRKYPRVLVTTGNVSLYDSKAYREIMDRFAKPLAEAQAKRPPADSVRALFEEPGQVPITRLFDRGDPNEPRQEVLPGELAILTEAAGNPEIPVNDSDLPTTGRRLSYAKHLTSGRHPMVARVLVNRVWMHHFGKGIVATPGDFGRLGEPPSHPELLDWLADDFMRGGWTLKRIHRMIMTSAAYRQFSTRRPEQDAIDPENRLIARMNPRRLDAESLRDAIIATGGDLDPALFGPPIPVTPDSVGQIVVGQDNRDSAGRPKGEIGSIGRKALRRSIYVQVRRTMPLSLTESFDPPETTPNCTHRSESTVAPQSLMLMNNAFVLDRAAAFANRVADAAGDDPREQVRFAWQVATAMEPTDEQIDRAVTFLDAQAEDFEQMAQESEDGGDEDAPDARRRALAGLCHALLCSNAFLYID